MAKIIRAEYLGYYNSAYNSDKVFNVFLIEEDDGSFSCISEYGRRGNKLVRRTLCSNQSRSFAEGKLRQKLLAKRNHPTTPYSDDRFGFDGSDLVKEYEFTQSNDSNNSNSDSVIQSTESQEKSAVLQDNVIEFPVIGSNKTPYKPNRTGIFNKEQFDSLEL